jgi:FlaA1/EpsC-like NDP-sugar epimerase
MGHRVVLTGRNHKANAAARDATGCEVLPLDVSHIEAVRDVAAEVRPSVLIHAAATKFVDLAERQPLEAIDVNVVGSENVARVAIDKGVPLVVGISTDKASPPVRNTYGLTKALMERLFCGLNGKTPTRFVCVRYGNVAWSTGSVLCIWRRMLRDRGVIGTTGPEMYRFFFTVEEAVELVVTALKHADELAGQVLSRHMKAAQMQEILKTWVKHRGGRFERIEGRPGERLEEFLIGEAELPYTRTQVYGGVTHYVISFNQKAAKPLEQGLSSSNTTRLTEEEVLRLIDNPPPEEV